MTVSNARIEELLLDRGYREVHATKKKRGYQRNQELPVYLNLTTTSGETALVLHPELPIHDLTAGLAGVRLSDGYYHSSNMRLFPKRVNTGATPVGYGWGLTFDAETSAQQLLIRLEGGVKAATTASTQESDSSDVPVEANQRPGADKLALAKRRIGQADFRGAMLDYWTSCAVTGLCAPDVLRASHIKPWKDATPDEKTDPFNGLLLAAHLDAAFDAGLISFSESGALMVSSHLAQPDRQLLGLTTSVQLRDFDARHKPYLAFHRSNVFRA